MHIYSVQQIRDCERLACERFAMTGTLLMQRAGQALFDCLHRRWPKAQRIAIFCGSGNNGGDGYVLALLLHQHQCAVTVYSIGDSSSHTTEAEAALQACKEAGVTIQPFHLTIDLHAFDVLVDAICGIGLTQTEPLREETQAIIRKIKQAKLPILAVDMPTGIAAETGVVLGEAIAAQVTVTFIGLKLGLLTGSGVSYAGEVICNDLKLPVELFAAIPHVAETMGMGVRLQTLKPRLRDWHKKLSGHVLIIGGETGYMGAIRMAGEAALRVGAGLVTVLTKPEHAALINVHFPELMCHGISSADALSPFFEKATVIVIGPGLQQTDWAAMMWRTAMTSQLPKVIDADALKWLAQDVAQFSGAPHWVMTPHPGEAAYLLATTALHIQQNRLQAAVNLQKKYGGVCVLKGAGSLVVDGEHVPVLCDKGNPGMATAGMGDILSGVIGGLIAQGVTLWDAARYGVSVHAMAGDLAAKEGGERGLIATDLLPYLRRMINDTSF